MSRDAPLLLGKALGFRAWTLSGNQLWSANPALGHWNIGKPTRARCLRGAVWGGVRPALHAAPHPACQCGLYAVHTPALLRLWRGFAPGLVHGAVLGWGRMQVHHDGWRAEFAEPVMFACNAADLDPDHCRRVEALGDELGLPVAVVADWGTFEAGARQFGEPVPADLRPPNPRRGPLDLSGAPFAATALAGAKPGPAR